ncbi:MAG: tetratricopeptide repeat protein, partial [Paramuribaculum sp.]|nr:tetratricopeptide repeat protein [Paramuribaculum sp.]
KRIGSILRTLGRSSEAVDYLRRAYELDSENMSLIMSLAGALLESGRPKEALNLYYKADYLNPGERTMRLIAWCLFMTGEYERSRDSYASLGRMPGGFSPSDLMNLGHLDIIFNRYGEAAEHYASAIADYNFDTARFESELASDRKILEAKGIDPITIDLIADRALRMSRQMGSSI